MDKIHSTGIPDFITRTYALFYLIGMWNNEDRISVWQYFGFIYYVLVVASVFVGASLAENGDEVVLLLLTGLVGLVTTCRMYFVIWKQKEIIHFTYDAGVNSISDYTVFARVERKLKNVTILAKIFVSIVFVGFFDIVLLPV